jgi:hypothetical protein
VVAFLRGLGVREPDGAMQPRLEMISWIAEKRARAAARERGQPVPPPRPGAEPLVLAPILDMPVVGDPGPPASRAPPALPCPTPLRTLHIELHPQRFHGAVYERCRGSILRRSERNVRSA